MYDYQQIVDVIRRKRFEVGVAVPPNVYAPFSFPIGKRCDYVLLMVDIIQIWIFSNIQFIRCQLTG